tara:strand:- start:50860 stop:56871 length:6012 start_codon:yes stop_codon:yes gene_type:complete
MAKPGKPNSFLKGMNADAEESLQPKQTYRYAKNARLTSFDGDNVSIQPYPSDKKAIDFTSTLTYQTNVPSLSYAGNWSGDSGDYTFNNSPNNILDGLMIQPSMVGNYINQGGYLDALVTIVTESGSIYTQTISLGQEMLDDYLDIDLVVANAINSNPDIPVTIFVVHQSGDENYEFATATDLVTWSFVNNQNEDDYVTNFAVTLTGQLNYAYNLEEFVQQAVDVYIEDMMVQLAAFNLGDVFWNAFSENVYTNTLNWANQQLSVTELNNANIVDITPQAFIEQLSDVLVEMIGNEYYYMLQEEGFNLENWGPQIVGTYPFSDYMVLLMHWPAMGIIAGTPDIVVKVRQQADGDLFGTGALVGDPALQQLYEQYDNVSENDYLVFYIGNLGFRPYKKLKVVGSEEGTITRRIYFTDTEFPLRSMNVGADPSIYTPWQNNPEYFNLFTPAVFSVPVVTGFKDGGSLDSVSYSYCFRYKTVDGRVSQISPLSNPASVPKTSKNTLSAYTKGAEVGTSSGKTMLGKIERLDTRFSKVQLIAVPYIDNTPAGAPVVFNEYTIPDVIDGNNTIEFTHTGLEVPIDEITIIEFNINQINWDTCKALETKDNRLFCGNLSNTTIKIDTDFTVYSYSYTNKTHQTSQNPNLYHDLMYSRAGLEFNSLFNVAQTNIVSPNMYGGNSYTYATDSELYNNGDGHYKYIKGPNNVASEGSPGAAYYYGALMGTPNSDYNSERGIFGAQSHGFDTPNEDGELEGVRVTFRMLNYDRALQLDTTSLLQNTPIGRVKVTAPFENVGLQSDVNNFYKNYANPIYNSNHVGYRRGEIYRFGILFYDKKGSPLFVKKIGDIRMPEHSCEYLVPKYNEDGNVIGFYQPHPYYYQVSRNVRDHGFKKTSDNQYNNATAAKAVGNILYPYFEVKISSKTSKIISGYSIVRVPRDDNFKTIVTSGILSRAEYLASNLYTENSDVNDAKDSFVNPTFPLWTPIIQTSGGASNVGGWFDDADKSRYYGYDENSSSVYTIDSPDALLNDSFFYEHSSADRLKIVESAYCLKQNIKHTNEDGTPKQNESGAISLDLSDQKYYPSGDESQGYAFDETGEDSRYATLGAESSMNQFACLLSRNLLEGGDVDVFQDEIEAGAWEFKFSNSSNWWPGNIIDFNNSNADTSWDSSNYAYYNEVHGINESYGTSPSGDILNLGYYTKYYSKRISCYPQYSLCSTNFADSSLTQYDTYFSGDASENFTQALPFQRLQNSDWDSSPTDFWTNNPTDNFPESFITYAKVVAAGEEIFTDQTNASKNYINGNVFQELDIPSERWARAIGYSDNGDNSYVDTLKYTLSSKKIMLSLEKAGQLPVTRQQIWSQNGAEYVVGGLGNKDKGRSTYSPEVTIAQIHRRLNADGMYGGYSDGAFSRNRFQSLGHYTAVGDPINQVFGQSQEDTGDNGNEVFGGDTFIGYLDHKTNHKTSEGDRAVCITYQIPLEADVNLDLRHGLFFGGSNANIPRFIEDDYSYNESYNSEQNILNFLIRPPELREVFEWPSTVAWSEQKLTGEYQDSYSIFPINQFRDLDYVRGPITQMFVLKDNLFSLQHSGTAKLSVNPRVLIKTQDGQDIQAATGTSAALERYDYISQQFGSQHFFGRAETDNAVYFYDDSNSSFLSLGMKGKQGGGFGVTSLGISTGMQSYFDKYKNLIINDSPLTNEVFNIEASYDYNESFIEMYDFISEGSGGISIGHDPEYSEVLLTLKAEGKPPETIVYSELLGAFTSFISKRAADYFKYKGRLYCTYNTSDNPLSAIYLANGYQNEYENYDSFNGSSVQRYLNFGGIDYYIWDYNNINGDDFIYPEDSKELIESEIYKEPFELEVIFNDEPFQSKLFDKIQLMMNSDTSEGYKYNYFRKFVFKGAGNEKEVVEFDRGDESPLYSATNNLTSVNADGRKTWYSVKDAIHYAPMRRLEASNNELNRENTIRGSYAKARMTLGWPINGVFVDEAIEYGSIKSEKFNIFSVLPFYRYSRI